MEQIWKMQEQVRQLPADKSGITILMNEYNLLANEKGLEAFNMGVAIKAQAVESEVMKSAFESTEMKGIVQRLDFLNKKLLKTMPGNSKSR